MWGELMFILSALSVLAIAAAQPTDMVGKTRQDYSGCLRKFMINHLEKKTEPDQFRKLVPEACDKEKAAFASAIMAQDKDEKMPDADAQEDAQAQVDDYITKFQDGYIDYLESNTMPG
jgi:hypothetical protein